MNTARPGKGIVDAAKLNMITINGKLAVTKLILTGSYS